MDLDIRTLAFVATLSSVLMALSLATLWWVSRSERSTIYWLGGAVCMAVGFLLIGFRHYIDPLWSIVVANNAILFGYCLHYAGIQTFLGKDTHKPFLLLLVGLVTASFVYFTYADANVSARIVIISWSIALVTAAATASLVSEIRKEFSVPEAFVAFFLFLYTVFMAGRGGLSIAETRINDFLNAGTVHALAFILIMLLSVTLSIGYSVMITGRLNNDLKKKNAELEFQKRALDEHAIVSITDSQRRITYVNDKFCALSGYSREELIGQSHRVIRSGHTPDEYYEQLWQALEKGETWHGELPHRSKQGQPYWSNTTVYPLLDHHGKLQSYVSLGTDITQRKELELALAQAHSVANFGTWNEDFANGRLVWSDEVYRILGLEKKDEGPRLEDYLACIHPDDLETVQAAHDAAAASGEPYDVEYRITRQDGGGLRWIHERAVFEIGAAGDAVRAVGTVHDITHRKEAEQSLEATKNRLQTILETASDGIHVIDSDGNVVQFSHSFARMLGYTVEEAAQLNVADWEAVIPTDALRSTIQDLIRQPATFETKHRRKDGSIYDAEINATGVEFEGQTYLYASCRDITDRKLAEKQLRQRTEDLEHANATLGKQAREMGMLAEQLHQAKDVAEKLAITDRLTGLFNRLKLDQAFSSEYERCLRYGHPLSVVIFDIDHFKSVNDNFGHQVGDSVLIAIADILKDSIRTVDIAGRWGGEEFLVISPETDAQGAEVLAEKIRQRIESQSFVAVGKKTASFGVAEYTDGDSIDALTSRADEALYRAKESGRNRVEIG